MGNVRLILNTLLHPLGLCKKRRRGYNRMAGYMTGQEWYDRFEKELDRILAFVGVLPDGERVEAHSKGGVLLAAKRAAGTGE